MYRGGKREKLTRGKEKSTVEGWSGNEIHMCDRQSDTLIHRHTERCSYRDAAHIITVQILRQQPTLTMLHLLDIKLTKQILVVSFVSLSDE